MTRPMNVSLGALLERQAAINDSHPFVTQAETGETLTYGELNERVNRLAHGLADLGLHAGDYVGLYLPNCVEYLVASFAVHKLGAVEVALNRQSRGRALERNLRLAPISLLVTTVFDLDALRPYVAALPQLAVIALADEDGSASPFGDASIRRLSELAASCGDDLDPDVPDTAVAQILFTSGTTGVSKGCIVPHRMAVRAAESMVRAFDLNDQDCVYSPYPLYHVGAAHYDMLAALAVGGRVVIRDGFSVKSFWRDVSTNDVTWVMLLGSVQQLLWSAPVVPEESEHRLRFVWGTPLQVDHAAFSARFGVGVVPGGGYGSTDAGSVAIPQFNHPGGLVLESHEVAVVDPDGIHLPPGEVGELIVREREPGVMSAGYFGMPGATAQAWRNGWLHTGDLARIDDAGRLYWVSRADDRIRVLGEMVSAYEIEEVLLTHLDVEDCAVIGVPAPMGDDDVAAFVTVRPKAQTGADELRAYCDGRMSRYMKPAHVVILDDLPRTSTGKPAKGLLRKRFGDRPATYSTP